MPELPEVEHLRRHLEKRILNRPISRVRLRRRDVLTTCPGIRMSLARGLLDGGVVTTLNRRGKQLAIEVSDGRVVCLHLGMSGRVRVVDPGTAYDPHTHCVWTLQDGRKELEMRFIDPRRFGGLWSFPTLESLLSGRWSNLGPDALSMGPDDLEQALAGRSRGLKSALLDQATVAGLGNIYVDEVLFRQGWHPRQPANTLYRPEIELLTTEIVGILCQAITQGGSTVRTWLDPEGQKGGFSLSHQVYGRGGELCVNCGQRLSQSQVNQRTTVWCGWCQRFKRRKS